MTDKPINSEEISELKIGSLIYRRNGEPVRISGETTVSWLVGENSWSLQKIKKSAMRKGNSGEHWVQFFVNQQDALDCVYAADHAYKIGSLVGACRDGKLLRKIADMVGYIEAKR